MGNKLKRSRHVVEPWCCLSTQLGPSIQLTKQRHSLGAALHSCFWSRCWAAATKAACAIAALRDEDKLQQHPILVFWTLLVPLVLKGMGTARGQAQHPGFLIGVISDHTVKWIFIIISICLGQCNIASTVMLHSPVSCMAAAHWWVYLIPIALCQSMQTGAQDKPTGMGGECRATLPTQKVKTNHHRPHDLLWLLQLTTPAVPVTMCRSSRHLSEAQTSKRTRKHSHAKRLITLLLSLPQLPDPVGSVSIRYFIFPIFNTANPAWSPLNCGHTPWGSGCC